MGIDPAPFWANLYLYSYEKDYIMSIMSSDTKKARKFKHASRFIDDQGNLNDGGEFGRVCHTIYPNELQLKCEHQGNRATFLDMEIEIVEGQFIYKLYDKRDSFPFHIVRMPDLNANIPDHIFYGSFLAEVLRICRATLLYKDFAPRVKDIYIRMKNQGGTKEKLNREFKKLFNKYSELFSKFNKNADTILLEISH